MNQFEMIEKKSYITQLPMVLKADNAGNPVSWITAVDAIVMACTDKVSYGSGTPIVITGGFNEHGVRSKFELFPIIFCNDQSYKRRRIETSNNFSNRALFGRDGHLCMYCGNEFQAKQLTRDHIIPRAQGGRDIWMNVITACKRCNHVKGARTPEEAGMPLLAVPYIPSRAMCLILKNRRILGDQLEFLKSKLKSKELERLKIN